MQSTRYNITANQAATFNLVVTWKDSNGTPVNLTNYTAKMQIRAGYAETAAIITVQNGSGITLGGSAGTITIIISATDMALLKAPKTYVYDLKLTAPDGTTITRLIEGNFVTIPAVTQ